MTPPFSEALVQRSSGVPEDDALVGELRRRGLRVEQVAGKELDRRRVLVTPTCLVVGDLDFMAAALRQLGLALPAPDDYPDDLGPFFHRRIWPASMAELRRRLDDGVATFAKPRRDRKRFTGAVFERADDWRLAPISGAADVWCAEPVHFLSEFRVFVADGRVVGQRHYDGDPSITPDPTVVAACVGALGDRLAGYALDVGVLEDQETAVVELNEGFAIGAYGLPADAHADVLMARWHQLVSGPPAPR